LLKYTDIERKNDVVCIVATGFAWDQCVFGVRGKDYWTLNNMYDAKIDIHIFDEWFQIHKPGTHEGHVDDHPFREFAAAWPKPLWVQEDWGVEMEVRTPAIYPIDEVVERYCPKDATDKPYPYFTNSVDYMILLAGLRGYKEIQLYGVEFISDQDQEYYKMRQSVNYYLGKLEQEGIRVVIQNHSSLLKAGHWYGYEPLQKERLENIMEQNLIKTSQDINKVQQEIAKLQRQVDLMIGGKQALEQLLNIARLRSKGCQI
jgi:hypothetical protein